MAETIADALGCDVADVRPDASLIEDLGAESIDFLDMVFRLERVFKVKIPRGKIIENARGSLAEAEFEQRGIVTEAGLAQLKSYLSEVPVAQFRTPMKVEGHPAPVHARDVLQTGDRRAKAGAGGALTRAARGRAWSDHFAAFSFVDRIRDFDPGVRGRGSFAIPAAVASFPACLVAEAVGPARRVGRDGAHRVSRTAGRRTRPRNAVPARRAAG